MITICIEPLRGAIVPTLEESDQVWTGAGRQVWSGEERRALCWLIPFDMNQKLLRKSYSLMESFLKSPEDFFLSLGNKLWFNFALIICIPLQCGVILLFLASLPNKYLTVISWAIIITGTGRYFIEVCRPHPNYCQTIISRWNLFGIQRTMESNLWQLGQLLVHTTYKRNISWKRKKKIIWILRDIILQNCRDVAWMDRTSIL